MEDPKNIAVCKINAFDQVIYWSDPVPTSTIASQINYDFWNTAEILGLLEQSPLADAMRWMEEVILLLDTQHQVYNLNKAAGVLIFRHGVCLVAICNSFPKGPYFNSKWLLVDLGEYQKAHRALLAEDEPRRLAEIKWQESTRSSRAVCMFMLVLLVLSAIAVILFRHL